MGNPNLIDFDNGMVVGGRVWSEYFLNFHTNQPPEFTLNGVETHKRSSEWQVCGQERFQRRSEENGQTYLS